jgi:hypothetical protein
VSVLGPEVNAMVQIDPTIVPRARIAHFYLSSSWGERTNVLDELCEGWERDGTIDWRHLDACLERGTLWPGRNRRAVQAETSRNLLASAWGALGEGRPEQAGWIAREALRLHPADVEAWKMVARSSVERVRARLTGRGIRP